ncbi:MAG TPA: hypothetical protein VFF06_00895 [Polyangia bacterium]|nr:hypothetical protein [Polyangia bacterium]
MLTSLRALLVLYVVVLAHVVIGKLVMTAGPSSMAWINLSEGIGVAESIAAVVALGWLFRARRGAAGAEMLQAALVLAVLQLVLDLVLAWRLHVAQASDSSLWLEAVLPTCVAHAADLFLWLALLPIADEVRAPRGGLSGPFFALLGIRFALWMTRSLFSLQLFVALGDAQARTYLQAMSYLSLALSVALNGLMVLLLARIVARASTGDWVAAGAPAEAQALDGGGRGMGRDLTVGAIWLGVGVAVTAASFAASAGGGGRFIVAYGAIIVGLARIVRGLTRRS